MRNRTIAIAALTGLVLLLSACDRAQPVAMAADAAQAARQEPARPAAPAAQVYETTGPLVVENQVDVLSQREGVVAVIHADVGNAVHKGDKLADLDSRQLQADRDAADAKVRALQFELNHWQEEVKVRQTDLARDEEMFRNQLITKQQVEHSRYNVEGGRFEALREAQNLKNAQDTLRSFDLELEKTRIVAPFDGVVARRYVRAGQHVAANERLFWVTALSPVSVRFTVPQEMAGKVTRGEEIEVSTQARPELRHAARIVTVSPVVDPASGMLEVQAQLLQTAPDVLPGMTARVRIARPR